MASEDLFENYSEEINAELHREEDGEKNNEVEEETEDMTGGEQLSEAITETIQTEANGTTEESEKSSKDTQTNDREPRLLQLPITRIRNLMKLDPDLHIASYEAAFIVTRATELFIESLARESYIYTAQAKKKTIQKRDVDMAIAAVDSLMFLEGAMNF